MNTLTLDYTESLPDSARLSRREFEKSMRFAMAAKLFELGRISSGQAAQLVPMDRYSFLKGGLINYNTFSINVFGMLLAM
jgi:predicted HTH domain antitoxin